MEVIGSCKKVIDNYCLNIKSNLMIKYDFDLRVIVK